MNPKHRDEKQFLGFKSCSRDRAIVVSPLDVEELLEEKTETRNKKIAVSQPGIEADANA